MSDIVRVVLAGAGRAGMVHGRNFTSGVPGARLVAVADPDSEARVRATAELGCEVAFDDAVEAVERDDVDAVVVAAPTFAHARIATAALNAGKHVLCEKPLAGTRDDARAIAQAERKSSARFVMGFMRRFDDGFNAAWKQILSGAIGRPVLVRSTGRGPGLPPEWAWDVSRSGGLIAEVNSHDLDTCRWLSGQELVSVYATARAAKRPDIAERYPSFYDVVVAVFDLSEGGIATVDGACPAGYGYDARVEVYGTEGTLLLGSPFARGPVVVGKAGALRETVGSWRELFADAYKGEAAHLVAVARGDDAPRATVDDGLRALEGVHAVNTSLSEGRNVLIKEVGLA
jgi:predicted dehydrogenase